MGVAIGLSFEICVIPLIGSGCQSSPVSCSHKTPCETLQFSLFNLEIYQSCAIAVKYLLITAVKICGFKSDDKLIYSETVKVELG